MLHYNAETMKGLTDFDTELISAAIDAGCEMFLDKGIIGWDENGNEIEIPPRLVTEYGTFVARIATTEPDAYINYRE